MTHDCVQLTSVEASKQVAKPFATTGGILRDVAASSGIHPGVRAREGCSASTTNGFRSPLTGVRPDLPRAACHRERSGADMIDRDVVMTFPGWGGHGGIGVPGAVLAR